MGIKKLNTFLNNKKLYKNYTYLTDLIDELKLDKNKLFIGIDGNLFCYKYSYSYENMLIGFYNQILQFLSYGYYPFYIFDGGSVIEKEVTINNRNKKKENNKNKLDKIDKILLESNNININEDEFEHLLLLKKKIEKNTIKISILEIKKVIELLDILNIPYIFSHGEGEYLAVLLNQYNIIDIFLSDDTDPIPAGINHIMKFNNNIVSYLNVNNILKLLDITQEQMCDFSILLGTDYASFYHNIKPEYIFEKICKKKTIENFIDDFINDITLNDINISNENISNENINDKKINLLKIINKIRNIYYNSANNERLLLINSVLNNDEKIKFDLTNFNININNYNKKSLDYSSNIILEFMEDIVNILYIPLKNINYDELINKTLVLKHNMINFIKKKKFNIKNIIKFLKENIKDITDYELNNTINSFEYLNTFN
jgi:hypothetical protein